MFNLLPRLIVTCVSERFITLPRRSYVIIAVCLSVCPSASVSRITRVLLYRCRW